MENVLCSLFCELRSNYQVVETCMILAACYCVSGAIRVKGVAGKLGKLHAFSVGIYKGKRYLSFKMHLSNESVS